MKKQMTLDTLLTGAKANPGRVVVPCADNHEALEAIVMALKDGIVNGGTLIGNLLAIEEVAKSVNLPLADFEIEETDDPAEAARMAARILANGEGDFLLKGQIDTKIYMKAILDKEFGLVPSGNTLSHVAIMDIPSYHKLLLATDAAITIEPTVQEKVKVVQNAIDICHGLGIARPKVSMVCAVEKVNPKMTSTVHAEQIVKLARDGVIKGGIVEGPYDFYISVSKEGAAVKGVTGEVAGDADILMFPEINGANVFYKTIHQFVPGARVAGLIAGAKVPIVLPSRADPAETKRMSLVAAAYLKKR